MTRQNDSENERLREILRTWDPAKHRQGMDDPDRARMRRRVLSATVEPVGLRMSVRALATAAVLVLTVVLGWGIRDDAVMPSAGAGPGGTAVHSSPATGPTEEPERKARQIQFATPGGTRVIWTLDPDFEV